jgi:uncharacterized repeat protein (TIGR01451 family)
MFLTGWCKWIDSLARLAGRRQRRGRRVPRQHPYRPLLEPLEPRWVPSLTTLVPFNGANGARPFAALVGDGSGNFYGTTYNGGFVGQGTVFELTPQAGGGYTLTTLVSSGGNPLGPLVRDGNGNLFGTTAPFDISIPATVFEIKAGSNTLTTLASFSGPDGNGIFGGLALDGSGNLYGTTEAGGPNNDGIVFELIPKAGGGYTPHTLAPFNGANGANPFGTLVLDGGGNLYGTTEVGGPNGDGTVFEVAAGSNTITTLASFNGGNGANPQDGLVLDGSGNLYGTTEHGGANPGDNGTVFEIKAGSNTIITLASFNGGNGAFPQYGTLALDGSGNLYGTTVNGGASDQGTLFEVAKGSHTITDLASFTGPGAGNGGNPRAGLVLDGSGNLFGTTFDGGGTDNDGTVFEASFADVAVAVSAPPTNPEGPLTYTIAVTNHGPTEDTNVTLTDPVPAGATFMSSSFTGYDPNTGRANLGTVPAGATVTGTLTVSVADEGGTNTDKAAVSGDLTDLDPSNNSQMAQTSVTEADTLAPAAAQPVVTATEGQAFTDVPVATFTDTGYPTNSAGDFTATIDWGDGGPATAAGSISNDGKGDFTVYGSHRYADEGTFPLTVTLTDDAPGAASATANDAASVAEADTLTPSFVTSGKVVEDRVVEGTAAIFRDTGYPNNDPADFSATFDWGDGTTYSTDAGNLTVSRDGAGDFTLTVSGHTYVDEGTYTVVATLADDGPGGVSLSQIGTLTAAESDTLVPAGAQPSPSVREGDAAASNAVAVFNDTGTFPNPDPIDFTATIAWGDGTSGPGTVSTAGDGNFTVSGSHAYNDEGVFTATTVLTDDAPGTASATATTVVTVTEGDTLAPTATPVHATEGQSFSDVPVATFTDGSNSLQVAADFTATIDWGDGASSAGTVSGPTGGPFTLSGSHTYTEDGTFTIVASLSEDAPGTLSATLGSTADVAESPVTVTGTSVTATEGAKFSGQAATFTDGNTAEPAGDYTARILWGDGHTSTGTVSGGSGSFTTTGSHTYTEEGAYTATVIVTDDGGSGAPSSFSGSAQASVANASLSVTGSPVGATEGATFSGQVATFRDAGGPEPDGDYAASIDWGDGSSSAGTVRGGTVTGSHAYSEEGSFTVAVTVTDDPGTANAVSASDSSTATVADASLTARGTSVSPEEGTTFSGTVATFGDADPKGVVSDYSATIAWGDGTTTAGTVGGPAGGPFSIAGQHIYSDDGTFPGSVTVRDVGGSTATAASSATVSNPSINLSAFALAPQETVPQDNIAVAAFTHGSGTEDPGRFSATIDWGDGTVTGGTVARLGDGTYVVQGSHTYQDESHPAPAFLMTVRVSDGSVSATSSTFVLILEAPLPTGTAGVTPAAPRGTKDQRFLQELVEDAFGVPPTAAQLNALNRRLMHFRRSRSKLVRSLLSPGVMRALHARAARAGGGASPASLINGYYQLFLDRRVDPAGLPSKLKEFRHGGGEVAVIAGILSSPEYYSKTSL